jgi:serine/threonine protein phosphatase 1
MLTFLQDASVGDLWLKNGGDATMFSYGVGSPKVAERGERFRQMRDELADRMPEAHLTFLQDLTLFHIEGDYVFVHAGIRPGHAIEEQAPDDLLWIRGEFLESRADHGKCVVHGHTITDDIETRTNRIGIDTGAYFSGKLTCLILEDAARSVLQT